MAGTRKRKIRPSSSVLEWIEGTDPEDIADALLSVDEAKAALVVRALVGRAEGEAGRLLDAVGKEFEDDPVGTVTRGLLGAFSGVSRRR